MLRPQFTNKIEISPTYQGQPALSLGYSHTKDLFTQVLDTTNVRATFITQENIADQKTYSLTLNVPTPIAKWWEGFFSLTGFHNDFSAKFREGFTVEKQFTAFNLYGEQTIRLPKGFSVQLSGWYNSRAWGHPAQHATRRHGPRYPEKTVDETKAKCACASVISTRPGGRRKPLLARPDDEGPRRLGKPYRYAQLLLPLR